MRCVAVHCWRSSVGMSRWCRKHTDQILDNEPPDWPTSRADQREQKRANK